jgi:hypothetical protein
LEVQARIPVALSALHNFIRLHDAEEGPLSDIVNHHGLNNTDENDYMPSGIGVEEGQEEVDARRDRIAEAMWVNYQHICQERGIGILDNHWNSDDDSELNSEEET